LVNFPITGPAAVKPAERTASFVLPVTKLIIIFPLPATIPTTGKTEIKSRLF
jgi:hypothetical protein